MTQASACIFLLSLCAFMGVQDVPAAEPALPQETLPRPVAAYPEKVHLDFQHFYPYEEVRSACERLAAAYPELASVSVLGQSRGGRDLFLLTLGDPSGGDLDQRPALYVDGNIHGNEVQGAEVCLYLAHYLLIRHGREPWVTDLLRERTFYLLPVVNPDSRVAFFEAAQNPHSPRENIRPVDDDLDLLVDEDGPEDLDGDGRILAMRVADPKGNWVLSEIDSRLMRPARTGEKGRYRRYHSEGIDNDGDGKINEDPPGGVDLNRNFPIAWVPPETGPDSGPYALSEPEARITAEFLYAHANVAGIQAFHNSGGMILRPPAAHGDAGIPPEDKAAYDAVGEAGRRFLPEYRYLQTFEGLYKAEGTVLDFGYEGLGIFTFSNELWTVPELDRSGDSDGDEDLAFDDVITGGSGFVEWRAFAHPQLGACELGGWSQWAGRVPPRDYLPDLCLRNALFVLFHARSLPLLRLSLAAADRTPRGTVRLLVEIENLGILPSMSGMARREGLQAPDSLFLRLPNGVEALGGGISPIETDLPVLQPDPQALEIGSIDGLRRRRAVLEVAGPPGARLELEVIGTKGGRHTLAVVLP